MDLRTTAASNRGAARSGDTLAERLEQGPLPFDDALRCARDVANHLRELHDEGRVHGEVVPRLIVLRQSGNLLMPPNGPPNHLGSIADVNAFGVVLYEMLTGRKPTHEELLSTPLAPPPRKGPGAVYAAAIRLAERCITAAPESGATMQKAVTELRLLTVQERQWEDAEKPAEVNAAPAKAIAAEAAVPLPATTGEDPAAGEEDTEQLAVSESPEPAADREDDPMADGKCPRCRCSKVRPSRPRNRLERLLKAIGFPVRRCHRCYYRYVDVFRACLEMPTKKYSR